MLINGSLSKPFAYMRQSVIASTNLKAQQLDLHFRQNFVASILDLKWGNMRV